MNNIGRNILALLVILVSISACNKNTYDSEGLAKFGFPENIPEVFAPGMISAEKLEHGNIAISPDGKEIMWTSIAFPLNENKKLIQRIKYESGKWTDPEVVSFSGEVTDDCPFYSFDGKQILYSSKRRKVNRPDTITTRRWTFYSDWDIWTVKREGDSYSKPELLDTPANTNKLEANASFAKNGNMYFLSFMEGVEKECGIYYSEFKKGKYQKPEALPSNINSKSQDWTPFIATDESYLIFSSNRPGTKDAYGDLYVSFNKGNNNWTDPVSLGDKINTTSQERFPSVSPDGKYLFFTRFNGANNQDFFWVSTSIIDSLKRMNN